MDEHVLRDWLNRVRDGVVSRREFTRIMVASGLTAPLVAQMLASVGLAQTQTRAAFNPTRRGGGGHLRTLWWQGPTLLNPHFAAGLTNADGSRVFYEPLAAFDPEGSLFPILAQEIPSLENGGVARDGKSVTWKLKRGVSWHDGKPFTADDLVFNWEYAADPATSAITTTTYRDIERVDKLDSHTVKLVFKNPTPFWFDAFCGARGMMIPKHLFDGYRGAKSREAPTNLKPVGTGPYRFVDFKPGDLVRGEINPSYHVANRPFFDQFEMKGGGEAASAARAVLQTGEFDFAWNLQVADEVLKRFEQGGKGHVDIATGGGCEHMQLNNTDPWREVDGERSSVKTTHPFLTDPGVRSALNLLVDRGGIHEEIYGRLGQATPNFLNGPTRFRSPNMRWEFNVDKANQILENAGWRRGADGVRAKDGKRLKMVFQTSINPERQKAQAIVKQACGKAGIELELKAVTANVFFSSDVGNPDTFTKFYSDLQMYSVGPNAPDPQTFMANYTTAEICSKDNKWARRNTTRWRNDEYDRLWKSAESEMDPVKRAALFIRMNDMIIQNVVVIPLVWRNSVAGVSNRLKGNDLSGWDSYLWRLAYWYRQS
ncbi:MAG TPA: peptide ABC transporter substrate-binding protein [Candidatus Polarisedimenticolia bacterium]|nr:peptide ABC transporter substrate-binding protein [Candidatus Polarisedimenticolia bacterium]